jgi:glycosyltransferase involved in cell wall biosynthesis
MKINLIGQRNLLGFGTHFAGFCDQFKKFPFLDGFVAEHLLTDGPSAERLTKAALPGDTNIWFFGFARPATIRTQGRNVVWAIFEHDKLNAAFVTKLNRADLIWTPSAWAKAILEKHGLPASKIEVVAEGVDTEIYHPYCRSLRELRPKETFRFLMIGKFEERKGYRQLLQAFVKAFGNDPKVELFLKGDYFFFGQERKGAQLQDFVKDFGVRNIRLLTGAVSREDLFHVYNMADAFVFPSRAEGWGLPLIEAMATGLPAIATNYSGHTEFLKEVEGYFMPISHKLVPINDPDYQRIVLGRQGDLGHWAEADVDDLAEKMRDMVRNYDEWRPKGLSASRILRAKFTWANAVHSGLESLARNELLPQLAVEQPVSVVFR